METNELLETIKNVVIIPILPVLTVYIIALIRRKTAEAKQKTNNDTLKKYITIAEDAVCTAVAAINQDLVDAAKNSGQFDQKTKDEALAQAKETAVALMGVTAQTILKEAYGDINIWLDSKIKFYVREGKNPK